MSDAKLLVMMRGLPLWQNVPDQELEEILELMHCLELSMGERLKLEGETGEALYIVAEGIVKLIEEKKGWETALDIFTDGRCIEELALFTSVFDSHAIVAVYPSKLLKLERSVFSQYIKSRPDIAWVVLENTAAIASRRSPVSQFYRQPLEIRLARYLLGLARLQGVISPGGLVIDYPLQFSDIQRAVGAREGEMVAALRSLVAKDVLDLSERLVVTNLEHLKVLAEMDG
ncbi:MAG: Crp/Fnr family transcriptional regulator [Firmicutes bacterium]|nr:Crp/Fnr family transcriptional regulator [Bacillota bacterium]